jgi:hypothetical protein
VTWRGATSPCPSRRRSARGPAARPSTSRPAAACGARR